MYKSIQNCWKSGITQQDFDQTKRDYIRERNTFYVKGKSGLKYPCGTSGSLLLSFAGSVAYPQIDLDQLPSIIERQQRSIAQLESELPTLGAIVAWQWSKAEELAALRSECEALQKRIGETLKEAERKHQRILIRKTFKGIAETRQVLDGMVLRLQTTIDYQ